MHAALVVADGYHYPSETHLDHLKASVDQLSRGVVRQAMGRLLAELDKLELGEWEELHTRTLDLSPLFVPYVGHVVWGDNYRRGEFMADLKRGMRDVDVDLAGELPDHIEPILRYVAVTMRPLPDLLDVLPGAMKTMESTLADADRTNPYRHLLDATVAVVQDLKPVAIGVVR